MICYVDCPSCYRLVKVSRLLSVTFTCPLCGVEVLNVSYVKKKFEPVKISSGKL